MRTELVFIALAASWHAAPTAAHASNGRSFFFGDTAAMTAGAGIASYRDSSALFHNPAGLGGLTLTKMDLTGTVYQTRLRPIDPFITVDGVTEDRANAIIPFVGVPASLVLVRNLDDRFTYGVGVFIIDSIDSHFREEVTYDTPGNRHNDGGTFDEVTIINYFAASAGYQISPRLRVGATGFLTYEASRTERLLYVRAENTADAEDVAFGTQITKLTTATIGLRLSLGAQWDATERISVGAVLRSPNWVFSRTGDFQVVDALNERAAAEAANTNIDGPVNNSALIDIDWSGLAAIEPGDLGIGVTYRGDRWWLGGEVTVSMSVDEKLFNGELINGRPVDQFRGNNATINASVGGVLQLSETLDVGLGAFTDLSPEKDVARFPDADLDYVGFTGGVRLTKILGMGQESTSGLRFGTAVAIRYAQGIGEAGALGRRPLETSIFDSTRVTDVRWHELGLHLASTLQF